jgi:preprotein translocase subunit SecY
MVFHFNHGRYLLDFQAFIQEFTTRVTNNNGGPLVIEIIIWLLVIVACVLLTMAIRKIPVQYARRTTQVILNRI